MLSVCRIVTAVSVIVLAGCATSPPNQGTTGGRMDPTRDAPSEYGSDDLRSQDLIAATDKMIADIASRPDINNPANPPIFFVGPIENETSSPHQNYQIFLTRLRAQMTASGTRHGLDVRRERDYVERMRQLEYRTANDPDSGEAYASANEYVLTCVVSDLPSRGTNYYLLEYQLVQLKDFAQSGPGGGSGRIVWSNFYEVKFQ